MTLSPIQQAKRVAVVTGSNGLIGSAAVRFLCGKGFHVIGIDNDMRKHFFGDEASTRWVEQELCSECREFEPHCFDIRDQKSVARLFSELGNDVAIVLHTAAQPSHDWAARDPLTDFEINALGTLYLLEATREHCPDAAFIFMSTNKVYSDRPNQLPLVEAETRWEIASNHPYHGRGIDEAMRIDQSGHSIFGASKIAADVMVQEYGRYFRLKTASFRGGCCTGPQHSGAELHGFLAYLMRCAATGREYQIYGYEGKQVRDNIHCDDLISAFWCFFKAPRCAEVYNIGGSQLSNCSLLEAIKLCEEITGNKMKTRYVPENRVGDHIWFISDVSKFRNHFPNWNLTRTVPDILAEIFQRNRHRW